MEHLACFLPGMLALGAKHMKQCQKGLEVADDHLQLAKDLTKTCYETYARTPTGLAGDASRFDQNRGFMVDPGAPWTVLRPETLESIFVLYQVTKDPMYQEWGWNIFKAIEKHCKTTHGFGAFPDVRNANARCCQGPDDRTETFFFAETIKYLYLLFDDSKFTDLSKYVFNTEAHPLPIPTQDSAFETYAGAFRI